MAQENEIKIIVEAEVNRALKALKGVGKESEKTAGVFERTGKRIKAGWVTIAAGAVTSIATIKKAFDFTNEFARFQQSTTAMKNQFGKDADEVIKKLGAVSGGTISNAKLIEGANRAMALNVTKDLGKMSELLETARFRAQAMGISTTQAFDDLTTGIGRNSPLILDNLGIITKGWAEEAKAAGVAYDQQFLLNKILSQGAKDIKAAGGVTLTAAERFQQMSAGIENAKISLGEALLPVFETILPIISTLVTGFTELPKGLKLTGTAALVLIPAIIALNAAFGPIGIAIAVVAAGTVFLTGKLKELNSVTDEQYQKSKRFESRAKKDLAIKKEALKAAKEAVEAAKKEGQTKNELTFLLGQEAKANSAVAQAKNKLKNIQDILEKQGIKLGKTTSAVTDEYGKQLAAMKELINAGDDLNDTKKEEATLDEAIAAKGELKKEAAKAFFDASKELTSNLFEHNIQALESEKQAIQEKVDTGILTEEEGAKQMASLDKKIAKEKRKQAAADKAFALTEIGISTAVGIARIWERFGAFPPVAAAMTAIMAGVGVAQAAVVASQPIPAFAMGTDSAPGGRSLVGEAGPEEVDLPAGARVTANHELMARASSTVNNTENIDNKTISMVIQPTNYEDFIRQAKQRLGKDAFT